MNINMIIRWGYGALLDIEGAAPTAELRPDDGAKAQTDEEDMGMSYEVIRLLIY